MSRSYGNDASSSLLTSVGMRLQIEGLDTKQQAWLYNTRSEGKWLNFSEKLTTFPVTVADMHHLS